MKDDGILQYLIIGYLIVSHIFTLVFYFGEIKDSDSFVYMLFVAPIVAEIKGLLFPFFL